MPIAEPLTASPVALTGVFSNGCRYRVPPFQRDYAWGPEEWEELWADLVALAADPDPRARHYLGALVLPQDLPRFTYRLGNLTPLEPQLNRGLGAKPFAEKRLAYAQSRFQLTRQIEAEEWTPETIRRRQEQMARVGVAQWQLDLNPTTPDDAT